jgi:DNA-directed RNA polymerase beta' subunit
MATPETIKKIKGIQFALYSPQDILDNAVCEITTIDLYERNEPKFNGLFDIRMGVIDSSYLCGTCSGSVSDCQGHFGCIKLVKKCYVPHYIKTILRLVQVVCVKCSSILPNTPNTAIQSKKGSVRFNGYTASIKERGCCSECLHVQPKITRDNIQLFTGYTPTEKTPMTGDECFDILSKITDANCKLLGFDPKYSRPEWMVLSVLPVGPPCIRPSVFHDGGMRSECDLTYKYIDILKCNKALSTELDRFDTDVSKYTDQLNELVDTSKEEVQMKLEAFITKKNKIIEDRYNHLQIHITTVMNNKLSNVPVSQNRSNRPFKCFTEKLTSKHGRVRGNLMGKRVDFSARSVITPDPTLSVEELGVPIEIAKKMTMNELVNQYNIRHLQSIVDNGLDQYPGALYITRNKQKYALKVLFTQLKNESNPHREKFRDILQIRPGDFVERHLMDGDYVLFNRQPSLHKQSMMAHKVRVLPELTFRLNPNACTP